MSITAKELAEKLGLSAAAVSMALNNKPGISEITREEVVRAARENGYDFRKIKRKVSTQGKIAYVNYKKHGAVVGDTLFFSDLTEGITRTCTERGYSLDIRYMTDSEHSLRELKLLQSSGIDGIILLGTEMREEDFRPFEGFPLPIVVLDTYFDSVDMNFVTINNIQGAYAATDYLIRQRKAQPGYLHSAYSIANFNERQDGFYKAVREHGYSSSGCIVHHLAPMTDGAYQDMRTILERGEKLASCYFADNDLIAAGAVKALREAGYRIPQDIAVIGFDNTSLCELLEPPLTTINVPRLDLGKLAFLRLKQLLSNDPGAAKVSIKIAVRTSLVRRASV